MNAEVSSHQAEPVYLDYAASTPVDPEVVRVMHECLCSEDGFANPASTTHARGRAAAAAKKFPAYRRR